MKTENETQAGEIRKLTNVTNMNNNQVAETQADLKRIKTSSQVTACLHYIFLWIMIVLIIYGSLIGTSMSEELLQ